MIDGVRPGYLNPGRAGGDGSLEAAAAPFSPLMPRELRVDAVRREAMGVVSLSLVDPGGSVLTGWEPGAHLDLVLPSGLVRQYSLCGDPSDLSSYEVAVLRDEHGRGGSREVHDSGIVGRLLRVLGPKNHFPLVDAAGYLFLAGGIGITPIYAMAREASRRGVPWRLVYGGRSLSTMAFVDGLTRLSGGTVDLYDEDVRGYPDLSAEVRSVSAGTAVYCCGPEAMIEAATRVCAQHPSVGALHVERFSARSSQPAGKPPGTNRATIAEGPDQIPRAGQLQPIVSIEIEVELRRTGRTIRVPPDRSVLACIREVLPAVLSSCEEGICGTCETRVLDGVPEHRDQILTPEQQTAGEVMMICVSRAQTSRLVLDL
jgi:ferredoxin-NADP reductase